MAAKMQELNFPSYHLKIKLDKVFDENRKKWVSLTPEEWVRQHAYHYLVQNLNYPASRICVEKSVFVNGTKKRCDIVVVDKMGKTNLLVECKSPDMKITQQTFDQIAVYALEIKPAFLLITNGLTHYAFKINHFNHSYDFMTELPKYFENQE